MSAQRARSSVAADHRSALANLPGVPSWAAVLIAVIATTIGFAVDGSSGGKELGGFFAALYVLGCVVAVLAVRQSGIFTALIQPPLILFVAVPGAYFLFHGAKFTGIKDTLINCGYPLIERFPLMLFTSAGVLLIGMARWYFGTSARIAAAAAATESAAPTSSRFGGLSTKLTSMFARADADPDEDDLAEQAPKRKHGIDRPAAAEKRPRTGRPAQRPAPTRSRHARPPLEDITEAPERPRRQPTRRRPASAWDFDPSGEPAADAQRRRPRPPREPGLRTPPPPRREPQERRDPYERRAARGGRHETYEPYPPYPPYEPPPRRRPAPGGPNSPYGPGTGPSVPNGASGTHHPISRVRYRDGGDEADRTENPNRPRRSPDRDAEAWRYDS